MPHRSRRARIVAALSLAAAAVASAALVLLAVETGAGTALVAGILAPVVGIPLALLATAAGAWRLGLPALVLNVLAASVFWSVELR